MSNLNAYVYLIVAVILGTASNAFAKSAQGFTLLVPSILTAITIVGCMFTLSLVMKSIYSDIKIPESYAPFIKKGLFKKKLRQKLQIIF